MGATGHRRHAPQARKKAPRTLDAGRFEQKHEHGGDEELGNHDENVELHTDTTERQSTTSTLAHAPSPCPPLRTLPP